MKKLALILAAFVFLGSGPAHAQGYVSTFACGIIPAHAKFDVEMLEDSHSAMRLRKVVVDRLVKRGYTVSGDAPLRLLIDPENEPGTPPRSNPNLSQLGEPNNTTLGATSQLGQTLQRLDQQKLQRESVTPGNDNVRVSITINRKSDGRCLWEGEVRYAADGAGYWDIAVRIAPHLVDAIGKPLSNAPFHLR